METVIYLVVNVTYLLISALQLIMLLRAIMSWLPFDDSSPLFRFVYIVTEPVILPVRNIMDKIGFLSGLPIDLSFLVTYMLLSFVLYLLPSVNF